MKGMKETIIFGLHKKERERFMNKYKLETRFGF